MLNRNIKGVYKIASKYPGNPFLAILGDDPEAARVAADRIIAGVVGLYEHLRDGDIAELADGLVEAAGRASVGYPSRIGCVDPFIADTLEAAVVFKECSRYAEEARERDELNKDKARSEGRE